MNSDYLYPLIENPFAVKVADVEARKNYRSGQVISEAVDVENTKRSQG